MKRYLFGIKSSITRLPDKKRYLELVTAVLSVPVLATAILLNFNNLKPKNSPTPTPTVQEKIVYISPQEEEDEEKSPTMGEEECTKDIAPLAITSPQENETVTDNPVSIDIDYTQGDFCSAVWSYRINDGKWSDYSDRSIALFNLTKGTVKFELRVKSIVTGKEKSYTRTFNYDGDTAIQSDQTASSSASQ